MTNSATKRTIDALMALWGIGLLFSVAFGDASADDHEESEVRMQYQVERFKTRAQPTFRLNHEKRWIAPNAVAASLASVKKAIANSDNTAELGRTAQAEASKLLRATTAPEVAGMVKEMARQLADGGSGLQGQITPKQQRMALARINAAITLFDAFFEASGSKNQPRS